MIEYDEEWILAFLRGDCSAEEREAILARMEESPEFAAEVRSAARGFEAATAWAESERNAPAPTTETPSRPRRLVPAWWVPTAAAAAIAVAVPVTSAVLMGIGGPTAAEPDQAVLGGMPESPEPSFVVVLQGRWEDAGAVEAVEQRRRASEYWGWANALASEGRLVAAGDLEWEPGILVAAGGQPLESPPEVVTQPDFLVGMFTIRAGSYEEALAIAQDCPHLRYGGSVSVRRVGLGFVTVAGMSDWAG